MDEIIDIGGGFDEKGEDFSLWLRRNEDPDTTITDIRQIEDLAMDKLYVFEWEDEWTFNEKEWEYLLNRTYKDVWDRVDKEYIILDRRRKFKKIK